MQSTRRDFLVYQRPPTHPKPERTTPKQQEYPNDLKAKVEDNVKNGRHPLDTQGQKGAISVFIGNLPFSVRVCGGRGVG